MKLHQETIKRGTRIFIAIKYIREHWYEWFVVSVEEGYARPQWYLPVRRHGNRYVYECWIFPLAPFALLALIIHNCFWSVWRDLIEFQKLTADKSKSASEEMREWLSGPL